MKSFIQKNRLFVVLVFIAVLVHVIFVFGFHELWWDSGVYAAMGKYIFSAGQAGLWEHIRPPLLPAVLGFFWFLGIDVIICGIVLELLCSIGAVILLYFVVRHYFNEKAAFFASVIFAFSPIFFYLSFHLYTEIPAVFLVLLAVYLFILKRYYWSGAVIGLAFLAKFPAGIFLAPLLLVLLVDKDIRSSAKILAGFFVLLAPVLVAQQLIYGNALLPFIDARQTILAVLGCNVLRFKPWWQYFFWIFSENAFNLFAVVGIVGFFRDFRKSRLLPFLCLLFPLVYFLQLQCRDYRYLALFIPFVAGFSGFGISLFVDSFRARKNQIIAVVIFLVLGFSVFKCALFFVGNEGMVQNPAAEKYYHFLENRGVSGEVWSSNPVVAFFTDARIEKIYYPVYDAGVSANFHEYLLNNSEEVQFVLLDNCGGGIICAEDDSVCNKENEEIKDFLDANFDKVLNEERGGCFYYIYERRLPLDKVADCHGSSC